MIIISAGKRFGASRWTVDEHWTCMYVYLYSEHLQDFLRSKFVQSRLMLHWSCCINSFAKEYLPNRKVTQAVSKKDSMIFVSAYNY